MKNRVALVCCVPVIGSLGCGSVNPTETDFEGMTQEAQLAIINANGEAMNGTLFNGNIANGIKPNGIKPNGIKPNGIKPNGTTFGGTSLQATDEDTGAVVEGMDFEHVELEAELSNGATATIKIESISNQDVPGLYTYEITSGGTSICGYNGSVPIKAIPLAGYWNYLTGQFIEDDSKFTIACRGAALAKCFEMGYSRYGTWSDGSVGVSNRLFHEACVRMVRGDYCGTGQGLTMNGTLIDVYDVKPVQTQTPNSDMLPEAEWSANGATCLKRPRWWSAQGFDVLDYVADHCPARYQPTNPQCMGDQASGSTFFAANWSGTTADLPNRPLIRNDSHQH